MCRLSRGDRRSERCAAWCVARLQRRRSCHDRGERRGEGRQLLLRRTRQGRSVGRVRRPLDRQWDDVEHRCRGGDAARPSVLPRHRRPCRQLGVVGRTTDGPTYDVQYPVGNTRDDQGAAVSGRVERSSTRSCVVVRQWLDSGPTSLSVGHQSQYEMFSSRDLPFHGDYNWISLAERADGTVIGYMSWTDNRNVVARRRPPRDPGPRRFDDGFDVLQCRVDLGPPTTPATLPGVPLARSDAPSPATTAATPAASTRTSSEPASPSTEPTAPPGVHRSGFPTTSDIASPEWPRRE